MQTCMRKKKNCLTSDMWCEHFNKAHTQNAVGSGSDVCYIDSVVQTRRWPYISRDQVQGSPQKKKLLHYTWNTTLPCLLLLSPTYQLFCETKERNVLITCTYCTKKKRVFWSVGIHFKGSSWQLNAFVIRFLWTKPAALCDSSQAFSRVIAKWITVQLLVFACCVCVCT